MLSTVCILSDFVIVGAIASYLPHPALGPSLPRTLMDYWELKHSQTPKS